MMTGKFLIVLGLILTAFVNFGEAGSSADSHWSYDELHGPAHWCQMDPHSQCCGEEQSPIDIDELGTQLELYRPLIFLNYTQTPKVMKLFNNGHTIAMSLGKNDITPTLSGGGLKDYYVFDSLHFHWGKDNSAGSEHTVSGKQYPLEMHMVHYNSKYDNKDVAAINPDGLAVLGVLFKISEKDNDKLQGIIKALDEVRYNNDSTPISEPFPLNDLLPIRKDDFFRYKGSLTTPPCSEVVTWTILDSLVGISDHQLSSFRTLRMRTKSDNHKDADQLVDNFRPTQSLNGRRIHARSTLAKIRASTSTASLNLSSSAGLVLMAASILALLLKRH
ncbi:Carbonic AnHydrase [Chamberlinius hualienensis]